MSEFDFIPDDDPDFDPEDHDRAVGERIQVGDAPREAPPIPPNIEIPIGKHRYEDLSGTAGTGKTTIARALIAREPKGSIILAATTGIAAVNLGEGTTINAALKYFDTASLRDNFTHGQLTSIIRKHKRCGVKRILIDEKSMMNGEQLTMIVRACEEANLVAGAAEAAADDEFSYEHGVPKASESDPIGVTLIGDFGQLSPVPDTDERTGKKIPIQYCFDSPEWHHFTDHRTILTKIHRQEHADFVAGLHAIRKAQVAAALQFFTTNRFSDTTDENFQGTTILAKNDAVDRHNQLRMDRLTTPSMTYETVRKGKPRGDWKQIPDRLMLKEGALVMILANRREYEDEEDQTGRLIYANGDLGELMQADKDGWWVKLHRTGVAVRVYPVHRENTIPLEPGRKKELIEQYGLERVNAEFITEKGKGKNEIVGTIDYMPLRCAYACTVHKTQGLTLDNVQVNIRDPFFAHPGMLFVALSRARSIEGLRIVGNQRGFVERCRIEPRVQPWL